MLQKRLPGKISVGLSPEAQKVLQQMTEESNLQQATSKDKRTSKGSVLFNEIVQIRQELTTSSNQRGRASCSDIFEDAKLDSVYTSHIGDLFGANLGNIETAGPSRRYQGRRRSSISIWLQRRESLPVAVDEVEEVSSVNEAVDDCYQDKKK